MAQRVYSWDEIMSAVEQSRRRKYPKMQNRLHGVLIFLFAVLILGMALTTPGTERTMIPMSYETGLVLGLIWLLCVIACIAALQWVEDMSPATHALYKAMGIHLDLIALCRRLVMAQKERDELEQSLHGTSQTANTVRAIADARHPHWRESVTRNIARIEEEMDGIGESQAAILRDLLLKHPDALPDSHELMKFAGLPEKREDAT